MVEGEFTGTGESASIAINRGDLSLSGTFEATVVLQRRVGNSDWLDVESFTGPIERVIDNGNQVGMRLRCTAYTSGTVNYVLSP